MTTPPPATDRLDQLLITLRQFTRERNWAQFHDPKNLSMLLASEAGELLQLFRWVRNDESDAFAAQADNRRRIEEELADSAIGVLLLADRLGIDLAAAVQAKIELNRAKYPAPGAQE
jgi:NTP pyrophosphatase (non-canonical NTP hydrolase)